MLPRSAQQRLVSRVGFTEPVGSALHGCALRLRRPLSGRIRRSVVAIFVLPTAAAAANVRQLNAPKPGFCGLRGFCFTTTCMLRCCVGERRVPRPLNQQSTRRPHPLLHRLRQTTQQSARKTSQHGIPVPCRARKLHHTARFNPELERTPPPLRRLQIQFDDAVCICCLFGPFMSHVP